MILDFKGRREARINEMVDAQVKVQLAEMIGRTSHLAVNRAITQPRNTTIDYTKVDYYFWDRFRRGKERGYELGAWFAQPAAEIIQYWVLGGGPKICVKSDTPRDPKNPHPAETALADFMRENGDLISSWYYDGLTLGDGYLVVNPDATLTPVQPSQIDLYPDPVLWRQINEVVINTDTGQAKIKDTYRPDGRTIEIDYSEVRNSQKVVIQERKKETAEFSNLIERIPVVHFANEAEANELYGHPMYAALLTLAAEYHDVEMKSINGVKTMGNPVPVISGATDPESIRSQNATGTETWYNEDGVLEERPAIEFQLLTMLILGEGAQFDFKSPGAFTQDTERMLGILFLQMLQHLKIPEWVWGGAVNSSMASVQAQTPAFHAHIKGRRQKLEKALLELVTIWLAMKSLTDPSLTLAEGETLVVEWPELDAKDEALRWQKLTNMRELGDITSETYVAKSDEIEDAEEEVKKAKEQAKSEQDEFNERLDQEAANQMATDRAQFGQDNQDDDMEAAA